MNRPTNRFERGSGVYTCRCCSHRTRSTGRGDNEMVSLCADCFDLAGEENSVSDNNALYDSPERVLEAIAAVEKKSGNTKVWAELKAFAEKALAAKAAA